MTRPYYWNPDYKLACEQGSPCAPAPIPVCTSQRAHRVHVAISATDAGTCFPMNVCECGGVPDISALKVRIRRRGQCTWLLEYPAWDISECGVEFRWDSQLTDLASGRYEMQFYNGTSECGMVELALGAKCPVAPTSFTALKKRSSNFPLSAPPGAFPVFDDIAGFTATLCGVLEKGAISLPLCTTDTAALCAISLCKAVQLEVTDGFNSELITFTGCTSGVALVTRGTIQHKFPYGSTVRFVWSTANAQAVCTPC